MASRGWKIAFVLVSTVLIEGCGDAQEAIDAGRPMPTATASSPPAPTNTAPPSPTSSAPPMSDPEPPSCIRPCGGDLRGFWRLESTCVTNLATECFSGIGAAEVDVLSATSAVMFLDKTLSMQMASVQKGKVSYTENCLARLNGPTPTPSTCAKAEQGIAESYGTSQAACTHTYAINSSCDCTFQSTVDIEITNAAYTVAENQFTYSSGGLSETIEYCVTGDELKLRSTLNLQAGFGVTFVYRRGEATCAPGAAARCEGNTLQQCDAFGSITKSTPCADSDRCEESGDTAQCVPPGCNPGALLCRNGSVFRCNPSGAGGILYETCTGDKVCVDGGAGSVGCASRSPDPPDAGADAGEGGAP